MNLDKSKEYLDKLLAICKRRGRILVLMQNSPDPDAIASAATVRHIVHEKLHKNIIIGYGGIMGRAENRAMVHVLNIDIKRITPSELGKYKTLCLVDTQPRAGNNALFTSRPADIVIDHHLSPKKTLWQATLSDVRTDYGATSTILYEYLRAAELKPPPALATALYYGIATDTQEFGREASEADMEAVQALVTQSDKKKLAKIRRAPLPPEYFRLLRNALSNAVVAGHTVVTLLRDCSNPDMFAEVAELMLRLDIARSSVCYGPCNGVVYLSARAADARGNVAPRMKRVVGRLGTGGGHRSMAGGQIPIGPDLEKRLHQIHIRIIKHFAGGKECTRLIGREE